MSETDPSGMPPQPPALKPTRPKRPPTPRTSGCGPRAVVAMVVASIVLAVVIIAATTITSVNTKADEAVVAYSGGPIEGTHFQQVIQPGSGLVWLGLADDYYIYPVTQRDYIISRSVGEGDRPHGDFIGAPDKDGVVVEWELAVYFKLNVSKIRKFHENVGLRYNAYLPNGTADPSRSNYAGWDAMLNNVFRQQIEGTVQRVSRAHSTDELARSSEIYGTLAREVASGLKDQVNNVLGDAYFCGPGFNGRVAEDDSAVTCPEFEVVVKAVTLPSNVRESYAQQKQAEIDVVTRQRQGDATIEAAKKQAEANVAEAEGKRKSQEALQNLYNDPSYIAYLRAIAMQQCAANQNCTLVITDGADGAVNVNVAQQPNR